MVELSFLKSGSKYICEFEVSSDFNLHIEKEKGGYLYLYQRSSEGGNYDSVGDAKFAPQDLVVDYDCSALVYPKYIKIVSEVEPSYAAITTDGEITEIKSQTKEVEITANGTTQVAPDAGFSYLTGVSIKTNVPQIGGGGGDLWGYAKIDNGTFDNIEILVAFTHLVRITKDGLSVITTPKYAVAVVAKPNEYINAIAINLSVIMNVPGNVATLMSIKDFLSSQNVTFGDMCAQLNITEITEEEFYNLG